MSQPADGTAHSAAHPAAHDQDAAARERSAAEVSDVLLNIEYALTRAKKAQRAVAKEGADVNAELALGEAVKELDRLRKRLTQDTYYAADTRLI